MTVSAADMVTCEQIAGITVNIMQMQAMGATRANMVQTLTNQGINPLMANMIINTAASFTAKNTQTAYAIARALCAFDMLKPAG